MAKCYACSIGLIARQNRPVSQKSHDCSSHLFLACSSDTDNGLLHAQRRVFKDFKAFQGNRCDRRPSCGPQDLSCLKVLHINGLLQCHMPYFKILQEMSNCTVNLPKC